jgi:hypothetical protein
VAEEEFGPAYVVRKIEDKVERISDQILSLAGKAEVAFLSARLDTMVPRSEHEVHWKRDDDRFEAINTKLDSVETKVDLLMTGRLPPWFLPTVAIAVGIATVLAAHFWK